MNRGGGVLIAVKADLNVEIINHPEWNNTSLEDLWITIIYRKQKIHCCCSYVPDWQSNESFENHLDTIENIIFNNPSDSFLILGDYNEKKIFDFNVNLPFKALLLRNCIGLCGLVQYNTILNYNEVILDLVLSNIYVSVSECSTPFVKGDHYTHHPALIIEMKLEVLLNNKQSNYVKKDFINVNYDVFNDKFNSYDWNSILNCDINPNVNLKTFYNILNKNIDENVKVKKRKSNKFPIWYSMQTIRTYYEKRNFFNKWKTYKNIADYNTFSLLRKIFN